MTLNINIFGVGRSATKSALIQTSVAASKLGGTVRANYEPYYWIDRHAARPNYNGISVHEKTPLFLRHGSNLHNSFIRGMCSNKQQITITKYIRGLGRVCAINEAIQADLNILVVRDLYPLLSSVFSGRWDLLGQGLRHKNDWERFREELSNPRTANEIRPEFLKHCANRVDRNALWWFAMNSWAIDSFAKQGGLIFNNRIDMLGKAVFKALSDSSEGSYNFGAEIPGHEIHKNNYFEKLGYDGLGGIIGNCNSLIHYAGVSNNLSLKHAIGSEIRLEPSIETSFIERGDFSEYGGIGKVLVRESSMYDDMQGIVEEKLSKSGLLVTTTSK